MPESGPYGSVRGALSNERPYRDVRREAGEEYEVQVLYGEGSRTAPAPSRAQSIARSAAKRRQGEAQASH